MSASNPAGTSTRTRHSSGAKAGAPPLSVLNAAMPSKDSRMA